MADDAYRVLLNWLKDAREPHNGGMVISTASSAPVQVTAMVVDKLIDLLTHISSGNDPVIVPTRRDLTSTEAAELLGVSRTRLLSMCAAREIAYHRAGRDRRFKFVDVMATKRKVDSEVELAKAEALLASTREITGRVPKPRSDTENFSYGELYTS